MISFYISGKLPNLNEELNQVKKSWANYHKTKRLYTEKVQWLAYKQIRDRQIDYECVFSFHWIIGKHDPDNICFGQKYILDGLVGAKIIVDDKFPIVSKLNHSFERGDKRGVRVTIEPLDKILAE